MVEWNLNGDWSLCSFLCLRYGNAEICFWNERYQLRSKVRFRKVDLPVLITSLKFPWLLLWIVDAECSVVGPFVWICAVLEQVDPLTIPYPCFERKSPPLWRYLLSWLITLILSLATFSRRQCKAVENPWLTKDVLDEMAQKRRKRLPFREVHWLFV